MRHLKSFESFTINELQDWTTLPGDVHKNLIDIYSQTYKELKSYLGTKFQSFLNTCQQVENAQDFVSMSQAKVMLESAERFFEKNIHELKVDDVRAILETEFTDSLKESWLDKWQNTDPYITNNPERSLELGGREGFRTPLKDVKGGIIQQIGFILQNIFSINLLSFGFIGSLISRLFGFYISPVSSILLSMISFLIIHIIRKLHKMVVGYK